MQQFFINANCPVPRFLFLDQPSQVYFPSELDEKQIDWNEVNKMYQFIIDRTNDLNGKLQVIIVDHADLKEALFRKFICEIGGLSIKILCPMIGMKSKSRKLQIIINSDLII